MSLGLLAKDSIQDLESFGRDSSLNGSSSSVASSHSGRGAVAVGGTSKNAPPREAAATESSSPPLYAKPSDAADNSSLNSNGTSQKQAGKAESTSYGQYSGFQNNDYDYHDDIHSDSYYYHDTYAPVFQVGRTGGFWENLLPCLFPWTNRSKHLDYDDQDSDQGGLEYEDDRDFRRTPSKDDDEVSNSSEVMGEKLSEKERMAVLNRLRLGQPEALKSKNSSSDGSIEKKGLLNGIPTYESSGQGDGTKMIRGILKNTVVRPKPPTESDSKSGSSVGSNPQARRRSLFPQYSGVGSSVARSSGMSKHVCFSPMARVMAVKSKNEMLKAEKGDIWWQKMDYDDFRRTGRIITRAMLEGGSEIWLSVVSNDKKEEDNSEDPADIISATGDKWWHKFGHSRRGLEHVVSIDEGRQRQLNVKSAIRACLEEQSRQRLAGRPLDSERLRHLTMQYTSWARDLSLASGASDADAVRTAFAEDRKSREFYLLKIARNGPIQTDRRVPVFMQPALRIAASPRPTNSMTSPHVLDANTAAQIRYRRKSTQKTEAPKKEDFGIECSEPVHDPEEKKDSISQRAAGFSAEGDEKVSMAAVMAGMGAIPQNAQVVSTA
jgi:hypothetical protein